jgi:trk system potassium uptake protein
VARLTRARLRRAFRRESIGVDLRSAIGLVGTNVKYLSFSLLAPTLVALLYSESPWPFVGAGLIAFSIGWATERVGRHGGSLGVREGFFVVSVTWLAAAAVCALTYLLTGEDQLANPIDAYFESMSGFTTTGATVLTDIEGLPNSVLFWRQFSQWLGGMGIIVLAIAVLPRLRVGGRQLLESEMPGPEIEQMKTRIRDTARRLWTLYIALTLLQVAILAAFGWTGVDPSMDLFEAVSHALTTMPTGGFSTEARSAEAFGAASQWTIMIFMAIAGANFALMHRSLIRRRPGVLLRDAEFRLYVALLVLATLAVTAILVGDDIFRGHDAIRHAAFQVVSTMTTTGMASTDFNAWPLLALVLLIGLMFIGGSAGSTAGSIKVVRHLLLGKILRRELEQTVHPEMVSAVRLNRHPVDERILRAVASFILLYVGLFAVGTLLLVVDADRVGLDLRLIDAIAAAATTLGNVGPGLGIAGPMGSFEPYSDLSKLVLIALMWFGRLEIIPIVVLLTRNYWRA